MSSYTVKIKGSPDVQADVQDNPHALNMARAIAIAIAKIRVGETVEVWSGRRRRLAFVGHEERAVRVKRA